MRPTDLLYDGAVRAARLLSPLAARGGGKLARSLRGRGRAAGALLEWAMGARDPARPLVWMHAPSVGEGLQARAVLEALRERAGGLQVVYTHTSPSAEELAAGLGADVAAYLPWDDAGTSGDLLDALRPSLVCFAKTEVWPGLVREAAGRGVPAALVAATLPAGAGRLRAGARTLLRPTFGRLTLVAAIAEEDAARFRRLGASGAALRVTGDPGIDSAAARAAAADPDAPHLAPFRAEDRPTLVAGSTWPPDEAVLVPAATRVRSAVPDLRLIVAPHEPTEEHLRPLAAGLRSAGWTVGRLGEVERRWAEGAGPTAVPDAVVVDRVGVLASLYTVGTCAWVGGGFGTAGLHSVLEPAAAGVPVAFGPRHGNARAAGDLRAEGVARAVDDVEDAEAVLREWLERPERAAVNGERASAYIRRHRGAAERTADMLARLVHDTVAPGDAHHEDPDGGAEATTV